MLQSSRQSLRAELIVAVAGIVTLAVLGLTLAFQELHAERDKERDEAYLSALTQSLAELSVQSVENGALDQAGLTYILRRAIRALSSRGVVAAELFTFNGEWTQRVLREGDLAPEIGLENHLPGRRSDFEQSLGLIAYRSPLPALGTGNRRYLLRVWVQPVPSNIQRSTQLALLSAAGVGVCVWLLGSIFLEMRLVRPLARLQQATGEIASGAFELRLDTSGSKELHDLADGFNHMTESLQTQREQLREQGQALQRAEKLAATGRLAAGVAHEVGNPLAAILGYIQFLQDPRYHGFDDNARDILARVSTQTQRIQTIIGLLLDYSRPEAQQTVSLDLSHACREAKLLLEGESKYADVEWELPQEAVQGHADPHRVHQILVNLFANATRAAMEGDQKPPRILVKTNIDGDRCFVDVLDNGSGVAEDLHDQLFEPFVTTSPAGEGTGLGLAVSQELAENMGGALLLVSPGGMAGDASDLKEKPEAANAPYWTGAHFRLELPASQRAKLAVPFPLGEDAVRGDGEVENDDDHDDAEAQPAS